MKFICRTVLLVGAVSIATGATPQTSYACGSPACEAINLDKFAARLDAAWKAEVTTAEQRQKMAAIIIDNTHSGITDWSKSADEYFTWRNGKPYVYVQPEPYSAQQARQQVAFKKQVEQKIVDQLVDPDSAKFEWPFQFISGTWKSDLFSKRVSGLLTCGYVNAKNRMGGYTGKMAFSVVIDGGQISHLSVDSPGNEVNAFLCEKARLPVS